MRTCYPRNEVVNERFKKFKEHVEDTYTVKEHYIDALSDCRKMIQVAEGKVEEHAELLSEYDDRFARFHTELRKKATQRELDEVVRDVKRCAQYEDFKDLYNKTVVPVAKYTREMDDYSVEHRQIKEMISKFD